MSGAEVERMNDSAQPDPDESPVDGIVRAVREVQGNANASLTLTQKTQFIE